MDTKDLKFSLHEVEQRIHTFGKRAATPRGRREILDKLEATVERSKVGGFLLEKLRLMYDYFRDPEEPMQPKLLVGGALLYLVVPGDVIPDWIPLIGYLDDFAVISYVWSRLQDIFLHYENRRNTRLLAEEG